MLVPPTVAAENLPNIQFLNILSDILYDSGVDLNTLNTNTSIDEVNKILNHPRIWEIGLLLLNSNAIRNELIGASSVLLQMYPIFFAMQGFFYYSIRLLGLLGHLKKKACIPI